MNIAYQCSNSFVQPLLVSLTSYLENNKEDKELNLFILSPDFNEDNLNKVKTIISKYNKSGEVSIIHIPDFRKEWGWKIDDYNGKWGQNSFIRLCLGKVLPQSIHKVLYLDSDVLICKDLSDLWNVDLTGYMAGGVADFISKEYYDYFGLEESDIYCNSGVILFNLDECRKEKLEEKVKDYLEEKNGFVFFVEQTVFNVVCKGKIKKLPLIYNVTTIPLCLTIKQINALRKPIPKYSDGEIKNATKEYAILHMISFFMVINRAWYKKTNYPLYSEFKKYALLVDGFEYCSDNRSFFKKMVDFFIRFFPTSILCFFVGMFYRKKRLTRYTKYLIRKDLNL